MMHWLSGGRILPILFDVSQIIVAPQLLKAGLFGLARPQGQKFQITAKGGDRNQGFVEWAVMRPFLILIVLSIAAVLWVFYVNNGATEIRYSSPALAWIWYNLVVLSVLCFVCVERPCKRTAERFASRELVSLKMSDRTQLMQLADLSITGARIFGASPCALGETFGAGAAQLPRFGDGRPSRAKRVRNRLQSHLEVACRGDPAFLCRRVPQADWRNPGRARRRIGRPPSVRLAVTAASFLRPDRH
jgi:hypothetical protein